MNDKILFGGSVAVGVIIVLASFASVVGFNSVDSEVVDSPLFKYRTNNAIDSETHKIKSEYVGKGQVFPIHQGERNSKMILIQKYLGILKRLDKDDIEKLKPLMNNKNIQNTKLLSDVDEEPLPATIDQWIPGCGITLFFEYMFIIFALMLLGIGNIIRDLTFLPTTNCAGCCIETMQI